MLRRQGVADDAGRLRPRRSRSGRPPHDDNAGLVAAFNKAADGPSYAAVVAALAKLAAGLQRTVSPASH